MLPRRGFPGLLLFPLLALAWMVAVAQPARCDVAADDPALPFEIGADQGAPDSPAAPDDPMGAWASMPVFCPPEPDSDDAPGGFWSELSPPARWGALMFCDSAGRQVIVLGGSKGPYYLQAGTWVLHLRGETRWRALEAAGDAPPVLTYPAGAFDQARRRLFVTGYVSGDTAQRIWELSLRRRPHWRLLEIAAPLLPHKSAALGYDPVRDRLILHGGYVNSSLKDEVWALTLAGERQWARLSPSGTGTGGRSGHSLFYDPTRDRMLVAPGPERSMWGIHAFTLGDAPAWTTVLTGVGSAMVHDPAADEIVFVDVYGEVKARSLATGALRSVTPLPEAPHPWIGKLRRRQFSLVLDPLERRLIAYGGMIVYAYGTTRADLLAIPLAGGDWSSFGPFAPGNRMWHQAVLDPLKGRMIVYGSDYPGIADPVVALSLWGPGEWRSLASWAVSPPDRTRSALAYDHVNGRLLMYGGYTQPGELWALTPGQDPPWTQILPDGASPGVRVDACGLYDGKRDRFLLFGGDDDRRSVHSVWEAKITGTTAHWTQVVPDDSLPFYSGPVFTRPFADEAWALGGNPAWGGSINSPLVRISLDGPMTFTTITPGGTPPSRALHALGFDTRRMRIVGVTRASGSTGSPMSQDLSVLWSLPVRDPIWTVTPTAGTLPDRRFLTASIYDPWNDRIVMYGGYNDGLEYYADVWALDFSSPHRPHRPKAHGHEVAELAGVPVAPAALALEGARPNPAVNELAVALSLPDGSPARLELVDVAGRRIESVDVGALGPGRHVVGMAGAQAVPTGVYWLRLSQGGRVLTAKAVIVR